METGAPEAGGFALFLLGAFLTAARLAGFFGLGIGTDDSMHAKESPKASEPDAEAGGGGFNLKSWKRDGKRLAGLVGTKRSGVELSIYPAGERFHSTLFRVDAATGYPG